MYACMLHYTFCPNLKDAHATAYTHTYVHIYIRAYIHTVHTACIRAHSEYSMHTCTQCIQHEYMHTYICKLLAFMHACIDCSDTYVHTNILLACIIPWIHSYDKFISRSPSIDVPFALRDWLIKGCRKIWPVPIGGTSSGWLFAAAICVSSTAQRPPPTPPPSHTHIHPN